MEQGLAHSGIFICNIDQVSVGSHIFYTVT